jgi:magnesium-transporting ATPase (P-type)
MITGDHPVTARAIARELGILPTADPAEERVHARATPEDKIGIVRAWKARGAVVAMTGDGVNDAPALREAHIGIAMGLTGTEVTREASDMVLADDNFASIVAAIEEGRTVFHNIRKFLTYILTSNVPEIVPYLLFAVFRIPLPLTVIQILAVDLGTDMIPALALSAEKPDPSVMRQPPRPQNERLLNWKLLGRAYLWLGLLEAAIAMAAFFHVLVRTDWCYGTSLPTHDLTYLQATTATLAGIVVAQVINAFNCRHPTESAFRFGLFANKLLILGVVVGIGLLAAIAYTPAGNQIFGTAPLPLEAWFVIAPLALVMLFLEETRKWLVRVGRGAKRVITRREPAAART